MSCKQLLEDRLWCTGRLAGNEALLKTYFKEQLAERGTHEERQPEGPEAASPKRNLADERTAQRIAVYADSAAFRGFPANNPYMRIFQMASELGDPASGRSNEASWDALTALVDALPVSARERLAEQVSKTQQLGGNEAYLRAYFEEEVHRWSIYPDLDRAIAYDMAGFLQYPVSRDSPHETNPYRTILSMAGELELPPAHRDETATWDNLVALVRSIPSTETLI